MRPIRRRGPVPSWPQPLEIRYRSPRRRMRAIGLFTLCMVFAFIPTFASFDFFKMMGFTEASSFFLAGCIGILAGMITAGIFT